MKTDKPLSAQGLETQDNELLMPRGVSYYKEIGDFAIEYFRQHLPFLIEYLKKNIKMTRITYGNDKSTTDYEVDKQSIEDSVNNYFKNEVK